MANFSRPSPSPVAPLSEGSMALASSSSGHRPLRPAPDSISISLPDHVEDSAHSADPAADSRHSRAAHKPTSNDSSRQITDNRAANLRADPLLREIESSRVFCTLCQNWVPLRKDSDYCVYSWLQHRAKCLSKQYVSTYLSSVRSYLKSC